LNLYKLVSAAEWAAAKRTGFYRGSADDLRDGFIHLSAADQVEGTARKYFADCEDLLLIAVDDMALGAALRWEPSRGGALFPHLYAPLSFSAVRSETRIHRKDGRHVFLEIA